MVYFVLDTETTGLGVDAEAWQIGIQMVDENGNWLYSFEGTCKPQVAWEGKARQMSGLTDGQLETFQTPEQLMQTVVGIIKQVGSGDKWENFIVCHNAAYDIPIIQRMLKQYADVELFDLVGYSNVICTMQALRMLKQAGRWQYKSCSLAVVHDLLGTPKGDRHTALADAQATAWLFFELIRNLRLNWFQRLIRFVKRLID